MAFDVGAIKARLEGDSSGLVRAANRGGKAIDRLGRRITRAGEKLKRFGSMGRQLATAMPAMILGGMAIRGFAKFDTAMTKSMSIMGDLSDQMKNDLAKQARNLALETDRSAVDMAESYFFLASAGMTAAESLEALPIVTRFAIAGSFDMATATDLLTDAQSGLGLSVKQTEENLAKYGSVAAITAANMKNMTFLSDLFVGANTLANTSVQQVAEALTNDAGAAMRSLNVDVVEGIAVLAAYADQGKKGMEAGSMFGRMLRLMSTSAVTNAAAFKKYKIEVFGLGEKMRSLPAIFKDLDKAMMKLTPKGRIIALRELGFEALAQKAITPLLGMSGAIETYSERLLTMEGITKRVMDFMMTSFGAQLKMFWNSFSEVLITIGEDIAPAVLFVIGWVKKLFAFFTGLPKVVRIVTVVLAALVPIMLILAGAAGTLLTVFGGAILVIKAAALLLVPFLPIIAGVIGGVLAAVATWGIALSASFAGLLFFLGKADAKGEGLIKRMVAGWEVVKAKIKSVIGVVKQTWSAIRTVWKMIGGLSGAWAIAKVAVVEFGNILKALFTDALPAWAIQGVSDLIPKMAEIFSKFWVWLNENTIKVFKTIYSNAFQIVKNYLSNVKQAFTLGIAEGKMKDLLEGVVEKLPKPKDIELGLAMLALDEGKLDKAVAQFKLKVGKKFSEVVLGNLVNFVPGLKGMKAAFDGVEDSVDGVVKKVAELKQGINAFDPNTVEGFRMGFLSSFLPKQKPVNAVVRNPLADLIPKPGQLMPSEKQIDEVLTGLSDKEAKLLKEQHGQTVEELRKTNTRLWDILQNIVPRGI